MDIKKKFVIVSGDDVAKKMLRLGFQRVAHVGDVYTFLNDPSIHLNFESLDMKKISYSDILYV